MTRAQGPLVIVGGGPACAAAARCLAEAGHVVVVLTAEAHPPYDRTQLSKQVLAAGGADPEPLWDPTQEWLHRADVRTGCIVERIDLTGRCVVLADGADVGYQRLLLATGASPRTLQLPGEDGPRVHHLRDLTDARALAADIDRARRIAVIGGGLIGLEVAAARRSPDFRGRGGGRRRGDPLLRSRGARGAERRRRHVVDASCRTSADGVWAAGDAVRMVLDDPAGHPPGRGIRLESFTDPQRQGEVAAAAMLGHPATGTPAPCSWSDQLGRTVSCIGIAPADASTIAVTTPEAVAILNVTGTILSAVCAAGTVAATGRLVTAARHLMTRQAPVDLAALAAADDLAALSRALLATLSALGPRARRTLSPSNPAPAGTRARRTRTRRTLHVPDPSKRSDG